MIIAWEILLHTHIIIKVHTLYQAYLSTILIVDLRLQKGHSPLLTSYMLIGKIKPEPFKHSTRQRIDH